MSNDPNDAFPVADQTGVPDCMICGRSTDKYGDMFCLPCKVVLDMDKIAIVQVADHKRTGKVKWTTEAELRKSAVDFQTVSEAKKLGFYYIDITHWDRVETSWIKWHNDHPRSMAAPRDLSEPLPSPVQVKREGIVDRPPGVEDSPVA